MPVINLRPKYDDTEETYFKTLRRQFEEDGLSIDHVDVNGNTALYYSCQRKFMTILEYLINKNAITVSNNYNIN